MGPRVLVTITTYNRQAMLNRLLDQIREQGEGYDLQVRVYDDGSDHPVEHMPPVELIHHEHGGRELFWEIVSGILMDAQELEYDYWVHLPDDVILRSGFLGSTFFGEAIETWEGVKKADPKAVCLSPLKCKRWYHKQWTDFEPKLRTAHLGGGVNRLVWQIQWNDLCWIADRGIGEALDWRIDPIDWNTEPHTSSRVPAQISKRLHAAGHTMYGVGQTLLDYPPHVSLMNPEERELNPLTT